MMGTHDEVTRAFFSGSDVHCAVIQRSGGKGNRAGEGTIASAFFSHHQKSVVCDAPPDAGQRYRKLVAFVGGLDLTKGARRRPGRRAAPLPRDGTADVWRVMQAASTLRSTA